MAEGTVHTGSSAKFPTKPTEEWKKRKMYAIKQIKICAEYRDMLPRPRLDLSGTHGLRPIGLSPGSWQTSLGLGSMSRYSAQILICIIYVCVCVCLITRVPYDRLFPWNRVQNLKMNRWKTPVLNSPIPVYRKKNKNKKKTDTMCAWGWFGLINNNNYTSKIGK